MGNEHAVDYTVINTPATPEPPEAVVRINARKTVFTTLFILSLVVGLGYVGLKYVDTDIFANESVAPVVQSARRAVKAIQPARKAQPKAISPKPVCRKTQVGVDKATGIAIIGIVKQGADGNWRLN